MAAIRQNYHEESEAAINKQINMELYASYVYQSMVKSLFKNKKTRLIHILFLVRLVRSLRCCITRFC